MITDNLQELAQAWLSAKESEKYAVDYRRQLEDRMKSLIGIAENLEGTETAKPDGYTIKVTGRIDHKIDADMLQEVAAEHGLTEHLSSLFRWKPDINMTQWRNASESITKALAPAITAKPGRPSFSIAINKE
jgi:hypothetical protein